VSTAATLDASPVGNVDGEAYVLFRLAIHAVAEGNLSLNLLNRLLYSAGSTQIKTATQAAARAALRVIATDDDAEICWQEEGASYRSFSRWRTYFEGRLRAYDAAIYPNGRQLTADDASASASTVPSDPAGAPISSTSLIGISDDMMAHLPPHLAKEIVAGAALLSLAEAPLHPDLSPDTSAADAVEGNDTSSHDPAVAEQECAESLAASLQQQQHQRAAMDWDTAGSRLPGEDLATLAQRVRDAFVKTINKFSAEAKAVAPSWATPTSTPPPPLDDEARIDPSHWPKGEDAAEIRAPTAQGDAGGRALEAQCESCGQWTYLTCGDLTRERASCVATEPAQWILNDLTRSSACRLTHYCDEICQEYDQIAHHHRTGGVCGSRRTPFAGAEA
jgi:hypothetical protein